MSELPLFGYLAAGSPTARRRAFGILLLATSAVTLSCKEVRVSAVDVARLEIEPLASLMVGDSANMNVRLLDAAGRALRGRTISWTSETPDVATIDSNGRVRGLRAGSTVISAVSEGASDDLLLMVAARPALIVDPLSVTLTARAGGPPPAATTVVVSATGPVTGLSVTTRFTPGQPAGWLIASLTGNNTPALLTLNISTAGLAAGAHDATVIIDAKDAEGQRAVPVTLIVQPQQPAIALNLTAAAFAATKLGLEPSPQTIIVTNAGGGVLDGLLTAIAYGAGQPTGWLRANLSGTNAPATITLQAAMGTLAAGSYSATVLVSSPSADNTPRTIDVSFEVDPAPPAITVSSPAVILNGTAGGPDPAPTAVVIANGGGGLLTGLYPSVTHTPGEPTGWLAVSLSPTVAPATLTITASTSALAPGSYSALIEIAATDASIAPAVLTVTLNATAAVQAPGIGASRSAIAVSAIEGGANPAAEAIAITNTGGGTLNGLATAIRYDAGQPTGWLDATLGGTTAPTTMTAQATTGTLVAGTYGATIEVSSPAAPNSPLALDVTFTVTRPTTIAVSSTAVGFSDVIGGSNPPSQAIDVTNGGGGTLNGLSLTVTYGSGTPTWLNASLSGPVAPASLNLQAVTGALSTGTYTAKVEISSAAAGNSPVSIDVTFTVRTPPSIALSSSSLTFQGLVGGQNPQSQSVDVTNAGGGTLDGLVATVTYGAGQPGGWLSLALSSMTAPTTLAVQADVGSLAAGSYNATIDVSSVVASNSPQTIDVSFTLTQPPAAPVLISAVEHKHHADLEWQDNSGNETSFIVQRSLQATSGWSNIATLNANTTTYKDDKATRGLVYYYRIAACNPAGCSISNVLSVLL